MSTSAKDTYETFAPSYDELTADYNHESWTAALLAKAQECGLQGTRLLDIGCGTGKSFTPMLDRGWQVTACDVSPAMVEIAQRKAGNAATICVADLEELPVLGAFDLVWAVNDTCNYLLDVDALNAALAGMRHNLAPEGRIVFDLNTYLVYRSYFKEGAAVERGGPRKPVWRGATPASATKPGAVFDATMEAQGPLEHHHHRQRHYPSDEVTAALEVAGLKCLDVSGESNGTLVSGLDEGVHTKAVYVACAASSP